jgi:hypothetical protein
MRAVTTSSIARPRATLFDASRAMATTVSTTRALERATRRVVFANGARDGARGRGRVARVAKTRASERPVTVVYIGPFDFQ